MAMAMADSPAPVATSPKAPSHPPYKEMIVGAIESLRERKGSSKRAIAKYIESNYHGLPPTHNALLSHHLARFKKEGGLQMVGKSYKLANSGNPLLDARKNGGSANLMGVPKKRGRPPKKSTSSSDLNSGTEKKKKPGRPRKIMVQEGVGLPSEKRKPGRPLKNLSTVKLILPGHMKATMVEKIKPGHLRKGTTPVNPESIIAMPMGEKRRPGRPKKGSLPIKQNLDAAMALGEKRKRGRPKRLATALALVEKRRPGRPKKLAAALALGEQRKPGRPKKLAVSGKRKVGRPKKLAVALGEEGKPGQPMKLAAKRKRGRPPTNSSLFKPKFATMLALGEKRKPGRPKKGSSIPKLAAISTSGEKQKRGRPQKNSYLSTPMASGDKRKPGRPKKGPVTPKLDSALPSGEKRRPGRPKKASAAMVNGGENAGMLPLAQNTAGEVSAAVENESDNLPAMLVALSSQKLVPNTLGEVSAAVEDGAVNLTTETLFSSDDTAGEVAAEALPIAATPRDVAIPNEIRKRGRPKKESTHPVSAAVQNVGNGLPNPGDFGDH